MYNSLTAIFLLFLVSASVSSDITILNQEDLRNPDLLKVLNNYFGCKTWKDGVCIECSQSYYFNARGVCCEVKPQCRKFNRQVGICQACYQGYEIVNGKCVLANLQTSKDRGCREWKNEVCSQCSVRYYFGPNNVCLPVDQYCRNWQKNGKCLQCYNGYINQNNKCVRDLNQFSPSNTSLCAQWKGRVCLKCANRAYFNDFGVCEEVNQNCNTWDVFDGLCLGCYKGYNLQNGACVLSEQRGPTDQGCKRWDWDNQKCLQCSQRWVFGPRGVCVRVNDVCSSFNSNGVCTACFKGYDLQNGACVLSEQRGPTDQGCKRWDWDNQKCLQCSQRWVFGPRGVCVRVNDVCSSFNSNGVCTACFKGYDLQNGACVLSEQRGPTDQGCKRWDWDNQKCLQCSQRWVFGPRGVCVRVNDVCSSFNSNGVCTACFKGYDLQNGACVLSEQRGPTDQGCKRWDWDNQKCLQCSQRWVFGPRGVCVRVNDVCSSFNSNGVCTACFKGYDLQNGACVLSEQRGPTDQGCKRWDWDNQKCLQCSQRWVFGPRGVCVRVNDVCSSFNSNGVCTACFKGYDLQNGACVLSEQRGPTDQGCKRWDWDNQKCLQCSQRWVFGPRGVCVRVNDVCSSFNSNGVCTACFKGYDLQNGACVLSEQRGPTDQGCKRWDWDNQKCLQCSQRWVFGPRGVCVRVNDVCSSFNSNGVCTACFKGYDLQNGACVLSEQRGPTDQGCKRWDWDNQKCLQCSQRWVFGPRGVCVRVNDVCSSFNSNGVCTACFKGYYLLNGQCQVLNIACKQSSSDGSCINCYSGYVLVRKQCVPISKLANITQYYAQCCPQKLEQLRKQGRV